MKLLWIVLAVLAVLLLLILSLPLYGKASIRIIFRKKLKLVLMIGKIPITLVSDKEKKAPELKRCHNPERVLRKERRLQKKLRKKAAIKKKKKALKAEKKAKKKALAKALPSPSIPDYISMVFALLRELYKKTSGRIDIHVRRMHLYLASGDAATTAILYAGTLQTLSYLFTWINTHFNRVIREPGDMEVIADFGAEKPHADIDIAATMHLSTAIAIAVGMLRAYRREMKTARRRAEFRALEKEQKNGTKAA